MYLFNMYVQADMNTCASIWGQDCAYAYPCVDMWTHACVYPGMHVGYVYLYPCEYSCVCMEFT